MGAASPVLREIVADAIRYWETRRILYNLVLAAVVMAWLVSTWPHFRGSLTLPSLVSLAVLAALANVSYSAAYLADIPMQHSSFRVSWRRWRWGLWLVGTLFAILIANYWIVDEIYSVCRLTTLGATKQRAGVRQRPPSRVSLGVGDPPHTWAAPGSPVGVGGVSGQVVLADLNQDGHLDLLTHWTSGARNGLGRTLGG